MSRMVGTVSMGIRAPIIRSGDDLVEIVTNSVLETVKDGALTIRDRDVIAMTEAIVARAQGNYASVDDIAADVRAKLGGETVGVLFPILSRNRFAICLRGIAKGARKVVLMLSYPSDPGALPGAVRLHRPPLHGRGLCGLLFQPDPGERRGGGGHLRQ